MNTPVPATNPCFDPDCAACVKRRCHTPEEWENHPMAGHGFIAGHGWTHPEAERLHGEELKAANVAAGSLRPSPEANHAR